MQSGNVNVAGTTTLAAGANDITLNNAGNNFSTVAITSGNNVTLQDANALDLGTSTVSGTLNVTANGPLDSEWSGSCGRCNDSRSRRGQHYT